MSELPQSFGQNLCPDHNFKHTRYSLETSKMDLSHHVDWSRKNHNSLFPMFELSALGQNMCPGHNS